MTRVASLAVIVVFGLLYAYDVWEAVGNLFLVPATYGALGLDAYVPYWLLWVGVLVPFLVFALALVIGRRRTIPERALLLLVGLAVVAALTFGIIALGDALLPDLTGLAG